MDWNKLAQDLLTLVLPLVAVALVGWLGTQAKLVLAKAKNYAPDLFTALEEAAIIAVKAAEQSKLAGLIDDKKAYALTIAENFLETKGLKVDLHLIDAAIEKAVGEMFAKEPQP
jgi:uncharacterized metal-binding protein